MEMSIRLAGSFKRRSSTKVCSHVHISHHTDIQTQDFCMLRRFVHDEDVEVTRELSFVKYGGVDYVRNGDESDGDHNRQRLEGMLSVGYHELKDSADFSLFGTKNFVPQKPTAQDQWAELRGPVVDFSVAALTVPDHWTQYLLKQLQTEWYKCVRQEDFHDPAGVPLGPEEHFRLPTFEEHDVSTGWPAGLTVLPGCARSAEWKSWDTSRRLEVSAMIGNVVGWNKMNNMKRRYRPQKKQERNCESFFDSNKQSSACRCHRNLRCVAVTGSAGFDLVSFSAGPDVDSTRSIFLVGGKSRSRS